MFLLINNRCVYIFLSNYSQINHVIEVIIIFCYKDQFYKEKESYTEKCHAEWKHYEEKKLCYSWNMKPRHHYG